MLTYTEKAGNLPFNWFRAISEIKQNYDWYTHDELVRLANSWVTCAVGNQCALIPRNGSCPIDRDLQRLGNSFAYDILQKRWDDAFENLISIEKRSSEILAAL